MAEVRSAKSLLLGAIVRPHHHDFQLLDHNEKLDLLVMPGLPYGQLFHGLQAPALSNAWFESQHLTQR